MPSHHTQCHCIYPEVNYCFKFIILINEAYYYHMKTIIYHNPRCGKSREALSLLKDNNQEVEIIEYLKDTPTVKQLKDLVALLGIKPIQLIRVKEELFKPYKNQQLTDDEVIDLMIQHPILIERPIVIKGNKAIIGRPPQLILDVL